MKTKVPNHHSFKDREACTYEEYSAEVFIDALYVPNMIGDYWETAYYASGREGQHIHYKDTTYPLQRRSIKHKNIDFFHSSVIFNPIREDKAYFKGSEECFFIMFYI